ncbi:MULTISPECIES: hypothetical protein [unclassified Nocardiopsis]|uniref:hypothetical protein n=1 Tax=unclassified Nocardiopsis TaxID=2649073 RepID=UPI001356FEFB|nr:MULTISPECIES: hypothetical protein [unclassified Nocardiopsis]
MGEAGTALFLAEAARELDEPVLGETVRPLARTAPELVEGTDHTGGLAGIGEFLLDAAEYTGQEDYRDAALEAAGMLLVRSDGTPEAPVYLDHTREPGGGGLRRGRGPGLPAQAAPGRGTGLVGRRPAAPARTGDAGGALRTGAVTVFSATAEPWAPPPGRSATTPEERR